VIFIVVKVARMLGRRSAEHSFVWREEGLGLGAVA
jgi:hypothetical protein